MFFLNPRERGSERERERIKPKSFDAGDNTPTNGASLARAGVGYSGTSLTNVKRRKTF